MANKKALIAGLMSQEDSSCLAELLLEAGDDVHGIEHRAGAFDTDHIYRDPYVDNFRFKLHYGDFCDGGNLTRIVQDVQPDEVYNLDFQSHVAVVLKVPNANLASTAWATSACWRPSASWNWNRKPGFTKPRPASCMAWCRKHRSANSRPFFYPRSRCAVAKLYASWITVNYREAYGIYACNERLFSQDSPRKGEIFFICNITSESGTPRREFIFVGDVAAASVFVMQLPLADYQTCSVITQCHINFGFGSDITIAELVQVVGQFVWYRGNICFDAPSLMAHHAS